MDNQESSFNYTYSAAQRQEVEHIRKKYLPKEEDKMEQLRRLHYSASRKARSSSITVGVIGALIMGTGMSLVMTELGNLVGELALVAGIAVGLTGMALVACAWPVYKSVLKKERERIAPEVLRLTEELLK